MLDELGVVDVGHPVEGVLPRPAVGRHGERDALWDGRGLSRESEGGRFASGGQEAAAAAAARAGDGGEGDEGGPRPSDGGERHESVGRRRTGTEWLWGLRKRASPTLSSVVFDVMPAASYDVPVAGLRNVPIYNATSRSDTDHITIQKGPQRSKSHCQA